MGKIERDIELKLCGLKVREAEGENEESRVVEGHAVVFGQRSVNLTPWSSFREVYEIMEPGCIDRALIDRSDVVLTAFHDNSKIMGRSVNGKGTLKLELDGQGLKINCEVARTQTGDEMLELIRRGDITGMSFCYTAPEDDSENGVSYERTNEKGENGKEVWLRHVKKVDGLYDVTIAGHPAYQQTDIANREIDKTLDEKANEIENGLKTKEEEEKALREAEEKAKMARQREIEARERELELMEME